jgi:hypothetical protein
VRVVGDDAPAVTDHRIGRQIGREPVTPDQLVQTDARSRAVLPGHPNQRFLLRENADGSILLEPVRIVSEAQAEYDESPELQDLLARAMRSESVSRRRERA